MSEDPVQVQVFVHPADLDRDPGYERLFPPLSEREYTRLAESIRRIGIVTPLCVARRGGRYVILDGHHRLSIAQELGIRLVPCRVAQDTVQELEFLYGCNLQRRHLTTEQWERLSEEFQAKLCELNDKNLESERLDVIGVVYGQLAAGELAPSALERLRPWIEQAAPPVPPAPSPAPSPEAEAQLAELAGKLEESRRLIRKLQAERDQLREAVEAYEDPAHAPAADQAALKHLTKELNEARRRLVDMSQQCKQAKEDRDRLEEELDRARAREEMWTNGERQLLANELDVTQQENQRLRDMLRTHAKAAGLLAELEHAACELFLVLDYMVEPWTEEERKQVASAYEKLAAAWEEVREPLSLALGGLPPGRSVFDRMFPDKRHREPLERLEEQAAREAQERETPARQGRASRRKSAKDRKGADALMSELDLELDKDRLLEEINAIAACEFDNDAEPPGFDEDPRSADCEDDWEQTPRRDG